MKIVLLNLNLFKENAMFTQVVNGLIPSNKRRRGGLADIFTNPEEERERERERQERECREENMRRAQREHEHQLYMEKKQFEEQCKEKKRDREQQELLKLDSEHSQLQKQNKKLMNNAGLGLAFLVIGVLLYKENFGEKEELLFKCASLLLIGWGACILGNRIFNGVERFAETPGRIFARIGTALGIAFAEEGTAVVKVEVKDNPFTATVQPGAVKVDVPPVNVQVGPKDLCNIL
jgi:hypothetical protein